MAYEGKSPKNYPQFFQTTMGQYWLGKIKLSDWSEISAFKSCHGILKKFIMSHNSGS